MRILLTRGVNSLLNSWDRSRGGRKGLGADAVDSYMEKKRGGHKRKKNEICCSCSEYQLNTALDSRV